jgi:hypothetical protein
MILKNSLNRLFLKCTHVVDYSLEILGLTIGVLKKDNNMMLLDVTGGSFRNESCLPQEGLGVDPSNREILGCVNAICQIFIKFIAVDSEEAILNIVKANEVRGLNTVQILCEILAYNIDGHTTVSIIRLLALILKNWTNGFQCLSTKINDTTLAEILIDRVILRIKAFDYKMFEQEDPDCIQELENYEESLNVLAILLSQSNLTKYLFLKNGASKFFKRTNLIIATVTNQGFPANTGSALMNGKSKLDFSLNTNINESKSFLKNRSTQKSVVNNSKVIMNLEDVSKISHHYDPAETNGQKILEQVMFIDQKRENHIKAYLLVLKYLFYIPRFESMIDEPGKLKGKVFGFAKNFDRIVC